ncbi:MAG: aldolase/citrate lyase family protein [Nitrososphaerota archaeon]|nr:aldolase/citrate lyase family protein [Candidatus Calditenuaceae archaeon]MDW8073593.1 aldolase/citrate lyase family protein [Nitrososphaerota archaeon]
MSSGLSFLERLSRGETVLGTFVYFNSGDVVEALGEAGLDFIIIDMEHGPFSFYDVEGMVRAAEVVGITPIIRTPSSEETYILRALECGARGIQVPHVDDPETARKVIEASHYYPEGSRGFSPYTKAGRYGARDPHTHIQTSNRDVAVIIQIESADGVARLPEILDVGGVDVIFLGPYDLSQSLGIPGQVSKQEVVDLMESAVRRARLKGVAAGTFVETPQSAIEWARKGIQYIAYSVDAAILFRAAREISTAVRRGLTLGE